MYGPLSEKTVAISETVNTPVIDKRSADTVVVTPSDRTVVIGGLISNQSVNQDNKIPLLGDIPLIGQVFKRTVTQNSKTELLIFLTPHVVQNPDDLSKLTDSERSKLQLKSDAFKSEDVNKYLDRSAPNSK